MKSLAFSLFLLSLCLSVEGERKREREWKKTEREERNEDLPQRWSPELEGNIDHLELERYDSDASRDIPKTILFLWKLFLDIYPSACPV
jgi:hypothetical protein